MKRRIILLLMAAMTALGGGCGADEGAGRENDTKTESRESGQEGGKSEEEPGGAGQEGRKSEEEPGGAGQEGGKSEEEFGGTEESAADYTYEDTIFRYGGKEYDMSDRDSMINAISECTPIGKYIVIHGHVGPHNGIYSVFNTETEEFEEDLTGALLTFYGDDINSIVYAFWWDVYAYDGTLLASYKLEEGDGIRSISYNEDHTKLEVMFTSDWKDSWIEEIGLSGNELSRIEEIGLPGNELSRIEEIGVPGMEPSWREEIQLF